MTTALIHVTSISQTDRALAVAVLLLLAGTALALVSLHLIDRGVDPLSMAVSDYGVREHPWFYRLAVLWLGLAGLLTAVVLADAMFPKPTLTILSLLVFAATRWAVTIFPIDLEGEEATQTGRTHLILGISAFSAIALAAAAFAVAAGEDPFWKSHQTLLAVLGAVLPLVAVAMGLSRRFAAGIFGLVERLYYLCMLAWLAAVTTIVLSA